MFMIPFSTFILAGMDTTSSVTVRLLHVLATHTDIQEKLRKEILESQAGEEMSYEQIMGLPYLDAVCRETLRLYVSASSPAWCLAIENIWIIGMAPCRSLTAGRSNYLFSIAFDSDDSRSAAKDTVLPLHEPIRGKDGAHLREIPVPKGTTVVINLGACNTNPAFWGPDALEWRPERWLVPLPRALEDARIPGVYSNM